MLKTSYGVLKFSNQIPQNHCLFSFCRNSLVSIDRVDLGSSNTVSDKNHLEIRQRCGPQVFGSLVTAVCTRCYSDHHAHSRKRRNALKRLKNKQHYDRLGVQPTASMKEIKLAYYELSKKYHPDVNKSKDATVKYSQISAAYDSLKNPENRLEEEEVEMENPFKHGYRGKRGRHGAKKPVKFAPEHAEDVDPRWPLGEEWIFSERHNTMFKKRRHTTVTSSARRIKIHETATRDKHFTPYPPPASKSRQSSFDWSDSPTPSFDTGKFTVCALLALVLCVCFSDIA